jgi:DinB family protein
METPWNTALSRQFDIAIGELENALDTCPDSLWTQRLWRVPPDDPAPPGFAEFWYVAYHTLFWLDLYLTGSREEDFAPPAPFVWTEVDPVWALPDRPYTKEELRAYLASTRRRCQSTLLALTDEHARRVVDYPWAHGKEVSYFELQLYNMRHVQEHAAQLSLFLGQNTVPAVPD